MDNYKLLIQNAVLDPSFKKNVQSQLNNIRGLSIKTDAVQLIGLRESIQKQIQDIKVGSIMAIVYAYKIQSTGGNHLNINWNCGFAQHPGQNSSQYEYTKTIHYPAGLQKRRNEYGLNTYNYN